MKAAHSDGRIGRTGPRALPPPFEKGRAADRESLSAADDAEADPSGMRYTSHGEEDSRVSERILT